LRRGEDRYNSTLGTYRRSRRGSAEAEEIAHLVARVWSVTPYPFETPTVRKRRRPEPGSDDERTTYWELEPGVVSRVRLAHDARLSGTARHTVGGAIGKTLDVMNVAAGLADKTEIKAKPMETEDLEFVDYAEFRDTLRHSDLTRHAQSKIRGAIDFNLAEQIRRGKGWSRGGQIVVEGAGGWVSRGGNRVPHFEKIARFSLAHLLDHEGLTRSRAPREFLAQFAD
jgi:hypothetical protein